MPLWIDNTGLHSAGRALDGRAQALVDAEGLLQMATLLVFGDAILVNCFEPSEVAARSAHVRQMLINMGVPESVIQIIDCPADDYWTACTTAATACADQLQWTFLGAPDGAAGTQPDMPREQLSEQLEFLAMAKGESTIPKATALRSDPEGRRAGLALQYMLATCPPLQHAIKDLVEATPNWTWSHTSQLDTYIRLFLNDSLASRAHAIYTPAVARARTVREYRRTLVAQLTTALDESLARLIGKPLGMPAVTSALLKRSKGDRQGLITEALTLRQDARELREWLDRLSARHSQYTLEAYLAASRELQRLVFDSLASLKLGQISDGIDISFTFGLPSLNASPSSVAAIVRRFFRRRQTSVLTEISKYAFFPDTEQAYYRRLAHECGVR